MFSPPVSPALSRMPAQAAPESTGRAQRPMGVVVDVRSEGGRLLGRQYRERRLGCPPHDPRRVIVRLDRPHLGDVAGPSKVDRASATRAQLAQDPIGTHPGGYRLFWHLPLLAGLLEQRARLEHQGRRVVVGPQHPTRRHTDGHIRPGRARVLVRHTVLHRRAVTAVVLCWAKGRRCAMWPTHGARFGGCRGCCG